MNQQNKIDELKDTMGRIINDNMYCILDEDDSRYLAEGLIEAGYVKSTDLAEEIFAEIEKLVITDELEKYYGYPVIAYNQFGYAELKEKYTKEGGA